MIVMQVFVRIAGVTYTPPNGWMVLDVPKTTYVGVGFSATPPDAADKPWTFAPPAADEPPPEPVSQVEIVNALQAQLDQLKAAIGI